MHESVENYRMDYKSALEGMPAPGNDYHPHLMTVANLGARAGLTCNQMAVDIRAAIQREDGMYRKAKFSTRSTRHWRKPGSL